MAATLSSLQSAVQLVSGANLAIFALPKLGQLEAEVEERRWTRTLERLKQLSSDKWILGLAYRSEFLNKQSDIEDRNISVRKFALFSSMMSAADLVWTSFVPEGPIDVFTLATLVIGVLPTLCLFANHARSVSYLKTSRAHRNAINVNGSSATARPHF